VSVLAAERLPSAPANGPAAEVRWRWTASLAAAAAGALHVAAAAGHLASGDLVVGFFLLTALAQLGLGVGLFAGSRSGRGPGARSLAAAVAGTTLLVGLYLVVHTTDLLAGVPGHGAGSAAGHVHDGSTAAVGATHHAGASIATDGPVAMGEQPTAGGEAPDLLGTATVALELLAIAAMTALLPRAWRSPAVNGLLALGALAWVLWLTGVLG
jgi:hypothetical protein